MTDDIKNLELRIKRLERTVFGDKSIKKAKQSPQVKFTNIRAFLNSIYKKLKNGQERLLVVAIFRSGGRPIDKINFKELVELWKKNKKFLGKFDAQYFTRAQEEGWFSPVERSIYKLEKDGIDYFNNIILKRKQKI